MNNSIHAKGYNYLDKEVIISRGTLFKILCMKLTILLSMFFSLQVVGRTVAQTIDLDVRGASIKTVLLTIQKQTDYSFVVREEILEKAKPVTAKIRKKQIAEALPILFANQPFDYDIKNKVIVLKEKKESPGTMKVKAQVDDLQQEPVRGRIIGEDGEPLIGATVRVKGSNVVTISDKSGNFELPGTYRDATLQIIYVGYVTREVQARLANTVLLEKDESVLEEVVAVAYGTQRRSSVIGSIATLKEKELTTVTTPNVNGMLQGKVAGVQVLNTSGRPGENPVIRIRGKSSLGNDSSIEPLWVIDGVVSGTGAQLNPNEIESISILKDASATALYGSRATNGVVLVTTKSGRVGENTISASAKFGTSQQHLGNFRLMDGPELYDYTVAMQNALSHYTWLNDKDALLAHNTDWFDFATRTGVVQNHTISHTLGTEKIRNFLSFDYYKELGTVKGYDFDRFSFRDNVNYSFNDKLKVHLKVAGSYRDTDDRQHSIYSAMTYLPWDYPINPDGTVRTGKETGLGTALDWHGRDMSNYLYNTQYDYIRNKQIGINGNFGFDYRLTDWLTFESNNNIGFRFQRELGYTDPRSIGSESTGGQIDNKTYLTTTRYANQLLRFAKMFNGIHNVNAFLGYEYSDYMYESTNATGQSIPIDSEVLDVAGKAYEVKGGKSENTTRSIYFNTNYVYDDKYSAQFSFRRDGSSKFGSERRFGNFWTVGAAWSLDKEEFLQDVSFVDILKFRVSYGSVGNSSSLGNYSYLSVYALNTNYVGIPAAFPDVLGNPGLTWEKGYETNFGIDANLFQRLNLTVEYYIKNTSDLLYSRKLSALTGYNSRYENIGALQNNGIEVSLSGDVVATDDWTWSLGGNFGFNKNKITELANNNSDQFPDDTSNKIFRVGEDRDTYYIPEWAGVDVYTGAPLWYAYDPTTGVRSVVTDRAKATRVLAGSSTPKYTGGINTSLTYKQITLSAIGTFAAGNKIYHAARQFYDNDGAYPTYNSMSLRSNSDWVRWQQPGDIATHPQAVSGGNNSSNELSTRYIEDGSYFRLSNVTLAYNLFDKLLQKANMKSAQIYISGENLWTLTKFSGADVEAGIGKSNGTYATDIYPSVRRFSMGINFSF